MVSNPSFAAPGTIRRVFWDRFLLFFEVGHPFYACYHTTLWEAEWVFGLLSSWPLSRWRWVVASLVGTGWLECWRTVFERIHSWFFHQLPLLLLFWVFFLHLCEEIPPIYLTLLLKFPKSRIPAEVNCRELRKKLGILKNCRLYCQPKNCWDLPLRQKLGIFCVQCRNNI